MELVTHNRDKFTMSEKATNKKEAANSGHGIGQVVERLLRDYFAAHDGCMPAPGLHGRIIREVEKPMIEQTLTLTAGNQVQAAKILGLNRNTLRKKIRELDIQVSRGLK